MQREKLFCLPHKGLRKLMAEFSLQAGRTDFGNESEVQALQQLGREMFGLLKEHAEIENTIILKALNERAPGAGDENEEEHEQLEVVQSELEQWLERFDGSQDAEEGFRFYLSFSSFHGQYLGHILHEETETQALLCQHFTDEELIGIKMRIIQSIPFEMLLVWMKHFAASQTRAENMALLAGMKVGMPAPVFSIITGVVKGAVPATEYYELMQALEKGAVAA